MIWKIRNSWFIYLHHVKNCYFLQNERDLAWEFLHRVEIRIISLTLSTNHLFSSKKYSTKKNNFPPIFRGAEAIFDWETQKQKSSWNYIIHVFQDFFEKLMKYRNNSIILCKSTIFTLCWHFGVFLFEY